jgi:hypothetical protein
MLPQDAISRDTQYETVELNLAVALCLSYLVSNTAFYCDSTVCNRCSSKDWCARIARYRCRGLHGRARIIHEVLNEHDTRMLSLFQINMFVLLADRTSPHFPACRRVHQCMGGLLVDSASPLSFRLRLCSVLHVFGCKFADVY